MSAAQILSKCQRAGIAVWLHGDKIKYRGPESAVAEIRPLLAAHKPEIVAYLAQYPTNESQTDCDGLPVADGPYFPWSASVTPKQVRQWQTELDAAIRELSALERWPQDMTERVRYRVERQPLSSLLPDLHWFREQISAVQATQRTTGNVWRGEGFEARHWCAGCDGSCLGKRCGGRQ